MRVQWLPSIVMAGALLAGCPGDPDNNGVAAESDLGGSEDVGDDAEGVADAGAEDTGPDVPAEPGRVVVDPLQLTFGEVRQGDSETLTVAVTNVGGSPIAVSNVMLKEFNRTGDPELTSGDDWETTFELGPGLFRELDVTYAPKDFGTDRGQLELRTSDPEAAVVIIGIDAPNAYADLETSQFLRFGEVPVGEMLTKRITIFNRGIDPLTISDIALEGITDPDTPEFFVSFPDGLVPTVLETNEDFVLDVRYAPLNAGTDRATVTLSSDDPDEPIFEIALTGNDPTPCLDLSPDPVDLGEAAAATAKTGEVVMLNCSRTLALDVTNITLTDDGGGVFALQGLPTFPLQIQPLQTASFTLAGNLADTGMAQGVMTVESSDAKFDSEVDLFIRVP